MQCVFAGAGGQRLQECGMAGASQSINLLCVLLTALLWLSAMLSGAGGQRLQEGT
jgi:hypothetical protein